MAIDRKTRPPEGGAPSYEYVQAHDAASAPPSYESVVREGAGTESQAGRFDSTRRARIALQRRQSEASLSSSSDDDETSASVEQGVAVRSPASSPSSLYPYERSSASSSSSSSSSSSWSPFASIFHRLAKWHREQRSRWLAALVEHEAMHRRMLMSGIGLGLDLDSESEAGGEGEGEGEGEGVVGGQSDFEQQEEEGAPSSSGSAVVGASTRRQRRNASPSLEMTRNKDKERAKRLRHRHRQRLLAHHRRMLFAKVFWVAVAAGIGWCLRSSQEKAAQSGAGGGGGGGGKEEWGWSATEGTGQVDGGRRWREKGTELMRGCRYVWRSCR